MPLITAAKYLICKSASFVVKNPRIFLSSVGWNGGEGTRADLPPPGAQEGAGVH